MKILLRNTITGLVPIYDSDWSEKRKLKIGEDYMAEIVKPRNYQFLKKFFALLALTFDNQDVFTNQEYMRKELTKAAGYYDSFKNHKGEQCYEAKSISFGSMTEEDFSEFYDRFCDVICNFIKVEREDIEREIVNYF